MTFTNWHTEVVCDQINNEEYLYTAKLKRFELMRRFPFRRNITASGAKTFANHIGLLTYTQQHDSDFLRSKVVWSEVAAFWMLEFGEWLSYELEREAEQETA